MIRHYFCEYCGKDFLSEEECMEHEVTCKVKIEQEKKKEEAREKELDALIFDFKLLAKGVSDYIKKYGAEDGERIFNEIFSKMNAANQEFKNRIPEELKNLPITYNFTLKPTEFNHDMIVKFLGAPKSSLDDHFDDSDVDKENSEDCVKRDTPNDEIDDIINKLSETTSKIEPSSRRDYIYNGETISSDELLKTLNELNNKFHFYF